MIIATINPTPPLSAHRDVPADRAGATQLRSATNPTSPVILLRGCLPIHLSLSTGQPAQWSVRAFPLSASAAPAIGPAQGIAATLSTDAVGFFGVQAIAGTQTYDWFVRFINLQVIAPGPGDIRTDSAPGLSHGNWYGRVSVLASYECAVRILLSGSHEQPSCYDAITLGVLQNMSWTQDQTLFGVYCPRGGTNVNGHLFEPIPSVASPNLDCGDPEKYPFYDSEATPSDGPSRLLKFDDAPGIVVPVLYKPNTPIGTDFNAAWAHDNDYLVLRKVAGSVSFVSAIGAKSKHAPHSYVVGGAVRWSLTLNQMIKEIPAKDFAVSFGALKLPSYLGASAPPNGTHLPTQSFESFAPPQDAQAAGIETFGPEATITTKIYRWVPRHGTLK
jgi:hypothetical protein